VLKLLVFLRARISVWLFKTVVAPVHWLIYFRPLWNIILNHSRRRPCLCGSSQFYHQSRMTAIRVAYRQGGHGFSAAHLTEQKASVTANRD